MRPDLARTLPFAVAVALAAPAAADAHVTVQPSTAPAGGFTRLDYRGGEKVSWTGAPGSDTPAPRVKLLAPAPE